MTKSNLTGQCRFRLDDKKHLILQVEYAFDTAFGDEYAWRDAKIEDITVNHHLKEFIFSGIKEEK